MQSFCDDAYVQDMIAPSRVEHRVEFGNRGAFGDANHGFGHYYNFLVYEFLEGENSAEAVHYLDEPYRVDLRYAEPSDYEGDFAQRILVFLAMRYRRLVVHGCEQLPIDLMRHVSAKRLKHLATAPHAD